jgi:hypothetical protein
MGEFLGSFNWQYTVDLGGGKAFPTGATGSSKWQIAKNAVVPTGEFPIFRKARR